MVTIECPFCNTTLTFKYDEAWKLYDGDTVVHTCQGIEWLITWESVFDEETSSCDGSGFVLERK